MKNRRWRIAPYTQQNFGTDVKIKTISKCNEKGNLL